MPDNQAEATNGPSAKKAKTNKESSSSEESSSEDEKKTKTAPACNINMLMYILKSSIHLLEHASLKSVYNLCNLAAKVVPAKGAAAAAAKAASSSSEDSSDSEEEKAPAKVKGNIQITN